MEDSNPQEIIAYLHVGFLDRCANHYTNLPYMPYRNCTGAFLGVHQRKELLLMGYSLYFRKEAYHAKGRIGGPSRDRTWNAPVMSREICLLI